MLLGHTFLTMRFLIIIIMMSFLHCAYIYIEGVSIKQLNRIKWVIVYSQVVCSPIGAAHIEVNWW
jgi:hypothetical protein